MIRSVSNVGLINNENNVSSKSAKTVPTKLKGLSVRSESDRNICYSSSKTLEPQKKDSLLKVVSEKQKKGLSPVSKSPHTYGKKKLGEEFIFKKPIKTVLFGKKKNSKNPESLAGGYYDQEKDFNQNLFDVGLDKEFTSLFSSLIIKPYEDDCFSDPEMIEVPPITSNLMDNTQLSKYSLENISGPEMPSL